MQDTAAPDLEGLETFIHDRRLSLGLTQQQLAERLGVLQELISIVEHGKCGTPSLPSLARLGTALQTSLAAPFAPQAVITSDNVGIQVATVVYYQIIDAKTRTGLYQHSTGPTSQGDEDERQESTLAEPTARARRTALLLSLRRSADGTELHQPGKRVPLQESPG